MSKERKLETQRKWRARNPDKVKAANDRQRAKGDWSGYVRAWRRKQLVEPPPYEAPSHCEACGRVLIKPNLDHCHATNRFRGWLCNPCNAALGLAGDTVEGVTRLLEYITRAQAMLDRKLTE
jgi:Recombination endonuclease VII